MSEKISIKTQAWMKSDALQKLFTALEGEARLVGGCVRDVVAKRKIKDIDIATPLAPEAVIKKLKAAGIKVIPTGIKHGTVTAVLDAKSSVQKKSPQSFEITTLRRDVDCDGRHAAVEFTDDWQEDAARRDFTMNALSMDLQGNIYDYFDGVHDLKKGIVRFVGDPEARVQEDYLRILRYFRFEAHFGTHAIDKPSLAACIKYKKKIATLSGERIQAEMMKLFVAPNPFFILVLMKEEGVLSEVIPGFDVDVDIGLIRNLVVIEREEGSIVPSKDALIRLALLLEKGKKQVEALAEFWKLSNRDKEGLLDLVEPIHDLRPEMTDTALKEILVDIGKEAFIRQVLLLWAREGAHEHLRTYKNMLTLANTWDVPEFPLKGEDIIKLGIMPGKEVGELLRQAKQIWAEHHYTNNKKILVTELKKQLVK